MKSFDSRIYVYIYFKLCRLVRAADTKQPVLKQEAGNEPTNVNKSKKRREPRFCRYLSHPRFNKVRLDAVNIKTLSLTHQNTEKSSVCAFTFSCKFCTVELNTNAASMRLFLCTVLNYQRQH